MNHDDLLKMLDLDGAHEAEDGGVITLTDTLFGIEAQAEVMVAPDAHNLHFFKKGNRLLHPFAHLEDVAKDHERSAPCAFKTAMASRSCFVCS